MVQFFYFSIFFLSNIFCYWTTVGISICVANYRVPLVKFDISIFVISNWTVHFVAKIVRQQNPGTENLQNRPEFPNSDKPRLLRCGSCFATFWRCKPIYRDCSRGHHPGFLVCVEITSRKGGGVHIPWHDCPRRRWSDVWIWEVDDDDNRKKNDNRGDLRKTTCNSRHRFGKRGTHAKILLNSFSTNAAARNKIWRVRQRLLQS